MLLGMNQLNLPFGGWYMMNPYYTGIILTVMITVMPVLCVRYRACGTTMLMQMQVQTSQTTTKGAVAN